MSVRSTPFMLHSKTVSTGPRSTICGRYSRSGRSLTTREEVAKRTSDDDIRERGANEGHICCELAEIQYPTFPKVNQEGDQQERAISDRKCPVGTCGIVKESTAANGAWRAYVSRHITENGFPRQRAFWRIAHITDR